MKDRLGEAREKATEPLRQATLIFLLKDGQILLAMKKRGFGADKWNGVGGKRRDGEKIEETAKREANEEIGVSVGYLKEVAILNFYFLEKTDWNQQVVVYLSDNWIGEPKESEEMAPRWFDLDEIPYIDMWDDDIFWLPKVLNGSRVEADFLFDENQKMIEKDVTEIISD